MLAEFEIALTGLDVSALVGLLEWNDIFFRIL